MQERLDTLLDIPHIAGRISNDFRGNLHIRPVGKLSQWGISAPKKDLLSCQIMQDTCKIGVHSFPYWAIRFHQLHKRLLVEVFGVLRVDAPSIYKTTDGFVPVILRVNPLEEKMRPAPIRCPSHKR